MDDDTRMRQMEVAELEEETRSLRKEARAMKQVELDELNLDHDDKDEYFEGYKKAYDLKYAELVEAVGEDETKEIMSVLSKTWNIKHSQNPAMDIQLNVAKSQQYLKSSEEHQDPELKALRKHIDGAEGEGVSKKMLREIENE